MSKTFVLQTNRVDQELEQKLKLEKEERQKILQESEQKLWLEREQKEHEQQEKMRIQSELDTLKKAKNESKSESKPPESQTIQNRFVVIKSHGLTHDEPLVLEEIIRSCFRNPARNQRSRFIGMDSPTLSTQQTADEVIKKINPAAISKLNSLQIRLWAIERLWDGMTGYQSPKEKTVEKALFLQTIQKSSWRGPFVKDTSYIFASCIVNNGNTYNVTIYIELPGTITVKFLYRIHSIAEDIVVTG